jgi:RecG-like helicase
MVQIIYNALITMSAEPGPRTLGLTVNNVDLWVQANDEMTRT